MIFICLTFQFDNQSGNADIVAILKKCKILIRDGKSSDAIKLLDQVNVEKEVEKLANNGKAIFIAETHSAFHFFGLSKQDLGQIDDYEVRILVPAGFDEHEMLTVDQSWADAVGRFGVQFNQAMYFALAQKDAVTPEISLEEARQILNIGESEWQHLQPKDRNQIHQLILRQIRLERELESALPPIEIDNDAAIEESKGAIEQE